MSLIPVLSHDLLAERIALVRRKGFRNLRIILVQPGPELLLRTHDDGPDGPECVVEIQSNGTNTVQSMIPNNDLETIVVL